MIKNIVFDIGNVLVTFHPSKYFQKHFQNASKTKYLCDTVFQHEAWERYDQGIYSMDDLHFVYQAAYPRDYHDISYILDHWLYLMELMEESFTYLKELKKRGFHIYLLSNISKDSADYLKQTMPFFEEVDGAVLSYEKKVNKPSAEIYHHLLEQYQLLPEETIFFDDNLKNIEQAKQMQIHGILFTDIKQAKCIAEALIERESIC